MKTKNFRRFLSVLAAAALLGSAAAVSASANSGDTLTSINVEPLSGLHVWYNDPAVAEEEATLQNQLAVKITLEEGESALDKGYAFAEKWSPRAQLSRNDDEQGLSIEGSTGVVFYAKLPATNDVCVTTTHTTAGDRTMTVGTDYYVLASDGDAWIKETTITGWANHNDYAALKFSDAFEGWVYIPWTSLSAQSDDPLVRVTWLLENLSADQEVVFGVVSVATSDGTITLPKPTQQPDDPAQQPTTPSQPANTTAILDFPIMNNSTTVAAVPVKPLGEDFPVGAQIQMQDGKEPVDSEWTLDRGWEPRAQLGEGWAALTDSEGLVFYIDLPAANKLAFSMYVKGAKDGGNFQQKVGSTYKVMANGANEWTERTAGQGQKDNTSGWGCMEFDSAFTGWVCLPWDSLYGELDNGDPLELNISEHNLVRACVIAQKLGGNTGTESLTFGPMFTMDKVKAPVDPSTPSEPEKPVNPATGETGSVAGVVLLCAVSLGAVLTVKKAKKRG